MAGGRFCFEADQGIKATRAKARQDREGGRQSRQEETVFSIHPSIQTQHGWQLNRAVLKPHYFQAYKPINSQSFLSLLWLVSFICTHT